MSFVKNKLKTARDALAKKDYTSAHDAASQVLEYEPENYNATVFIGLSLLELGRHEESEKAYLRAISLNKEHPLAWQGLSKFYEREEKWKKLADTLIELMKVYGSSNDAAKCAEAWQKLVGLCRERCTKLELVQALSFVLPESPLYSTFSTLPPPNPTEPLGSTTSAAQTAVHSSLPTIEEIVNLLETYEEETMAKEVEKRRTRLGAARPEVLRKEVGREIWRTSKLSAFYNEILNHRDTSDELRRLTDSKLLRYKDRYLHALPDTADFINEKHQLRREVDELVSGAMILRLPDELAWMIFLEGQDNESVAHYDHGPIKHFLDLFPSSPTASLLKGYFAYFDLTLSSEEEADSNKVPEVLRTEEDPFDTILNAYAVIPNTLISNRVVAELYNHEHDYENAIRISENGLKIVGQSEANAGWKLPRVTKQFRVILATSFVHLYPPKHHPRALSIIDDLLTQFPDNVACLMGRGYILQEAKEWEDASSCFDHVIALLSDNLREGLRAKEESAWCSYQVDDLDTAFSGLQGVLTVLKDQDDCFEDIARCLWRMGQCCWKMGGEKCEEAYAFFVKSLKADSSYAPAFTSLGIYYIEFASPPDPNRASKCFQKAFELDPREAEAARRLAESFAEEREWDLVEVVARRTIEGEGGDAGARGPQTSTVNRYLPKNVWAWKALGAVEYHRKNFESAIEAFQIVLRAEPEDSLSWLRLGEAYGKAGRHVAAIKALTRAQELQPENWMCQYLIGEVKYNMGIFTAAIVAFESVLQNKPSEVGTLVFLCKAHLANGEVELATGFHARAEHSFLRCISIGLETIYQSPGFRGIVWKSVADAVYALSKFSTPNPGNVRQVLQKVSALLPAETAHARSPMRRSFLDDGDQITQLHILELAVAAHSYRISLGSSEALPRGGSAWFDLGLCLQLLSARSADSEAAAEAANQGITCITHALQEDQASDTFWVGLGHSYFLTNVKASQHAYIKALEINPKGVVAWTSLGLLYLHYNDVELANEALYRAQILDPDHSLVWIGQALVAAANKHDLEAAAMLDHAVTLSASVPEGDLEFASRLFSRIRLSRGNHQESLDQLLPAFFVLNRYCRSRPDEPTALHLFGLVCERLGHFETGVTLISRAIANLELAYEETEDPEIAKRYAIANVTLARLCLALQDYPRSIESYESALGLLSSGEEDRDFWSYLLNVQVRFGIGLASLMRGELEKALESFEVALESAGSDMVLRGQITILLAQTMWAIQTDEFKETAKSQLLECITSDPENLTAINMLAGMGVLTDDDNLVDAALSEILALPVERRHELDPQRDVDYLLTQYHIRQGNFKKALSVAQSAFFAEPSSAEVRNRLGSLMLEGGQLTSAVAILSTSNKNSDSTILSESLYLQALGKAMNGDRDETAKRDVQKAIMLHPWKIDYWRGLGVVRASEACQKAF